MAADQPSQKQGKTTAAATGTTSPNHNNATKSRPKERVPNKSELTDINQALMCSLCSGYLIDATAIIECQHTFCKSCILKYLETNGYCPICDIELNTVKPHLSLRSDVILQRLVYKLVPSLLVSELRRRKDHAEEKENVLKAAECVSDTMALEVDAASDLSTILSLDDVVSLSIEYFRGTPLGNDEATNVSNVSVKPKPASQKQDKLSTSTNATVHQAIEDVNCSKESMDANDRRYLKCPAAISVGLLKKFIRMKYGLSDDYRVDLLYNGVRDNSLESELTLLDIAFIFKWNKDEPMRFHYQIFDRTVKSLPNRAGSKRSASSMMDEPPDDDATSGPHNNNNRQPPMTSASPSSKIPRVSNNSSTTGANNSNSGGGRTGGSSRTTTAATSSTSPSTPVYDFSEGNSDTEEPIQPMQHKGKLKLRGFRRETSNTCNVIESSSTSSKNSQGSKRSPPSMASTHKKSLIKGRRRSSGSGGGKSPARSNSIGSITDDHSEDADSDSSSSDEDDDDVSDGAKTAELTNSRVRSAAQTVMAAQQQQQQQVNGAIKREPLKLSLGSVLVAKSPEHKHKHKHHHKMKHKKKHKALKISLSLNPNTANAGSSSSNRVGNVNVNQSQNNHNKQQQPTGSGGTVVKVEGKGPKLIFGLGQAKTEGKLGGNGPSGSTNSQSNFPVNVKPTTSAHLSNMSKSISVSIGVGNNSQKTGNNNLTTTATAANQLAKKILNSASTTTTLVPNNNKKGSQQTTTANQNTNSSSSTSSSRSHPLLPDSVHVPKSVTLIPVNPSQSGGSNATSSGVGGRGMGNISSGGGNVGVMDKSSVSSSNSSTSSTSTTRLNAHTFTNPITNKSLHQITVTEVPPPPKSGSGPNASGISSGGSANNLGNNSNSGGSNAPSSLLSNPIEKVIANAANNKPQFNGPGSMEITKIYCNSKENPTTKKLKERKGLDISITVPPGMSIKDKSKTTKLEETLRQKMGLHNNLSNSSSNLTNANNANASMNSKIKGNNAQNSGPLFNVGCNAKMPPGITIGPVGGGSKQQQSISSSGNVGSTTTSGNNNNTTIPGLGFTLPPHITAHPQHPPQSTTSAANKQMLVVNQMKQNQGGDIKPTLIIPSSTKGKNVQMGGGGNKTKDLPISCIGSVAPKGNQTSKAYENRKQLGEALASMIDMANRNALKSPSPPKNPSQQVKQDHQQQHHHPQNVKSGSSGGVKLNQSSCEKRALDMSSSSATGAASSRKNSRESPEPKRSKTNESSSSTTTPGGKSATSESPLDLSGTGRPNSRPNSNSSSPIHHHQNVKTASHHSSSSAATTAAAGGSFSSHHHHEKVAMKHNNNEQPPLGKKCPTPVPKISPPQTNPVTTTTTPTGFPSPSSGGKSSKGSTPTGSSPSILSIAQNLAQKQLNQQQQQQKEQFLQIMHLQQGLQNMHAVNSLSHLQQQGKGGNSGVSLLGNSLSPKGSSSHHPQHASLNSLSPPMGIMSMPNPSPPSGAGATSGFDPLRNLLTLSDAAVAARHGKVHPMNSLMAAVGLHHTGLSPSNPSSVTSASLFPHLANSLGGGKLDPGSAHAYLAAISAHNERLAVAAGLGHFGHGGDHSPPMSLAAANSFFNSQQQQQQVRPNSPQIRVGPSASSSSNKASNNNSNHGKNNNKLGSPPLSSSYSHHQHHHHTPAVVAPRSPNKSMPTTPAVSSSSHSNKSSSHHDSSSSSSNMKTPTRINGTTPSPYSSLGHLPIFPPGIHNPILPTYSRSMTTTHCSQSSASSASPILSSSSTTNSSSKAGTTGSDKKGIPNSMKISNFLPSKPKDGKTQADNSTAEATITSGSNVGGGTSLTKFLNSIPPLIVSPQQSNLSVSSSPSATLPKEHASTTTSRGLTGSSSNNKSSNEQECRSNKSNKSSDSNKSSSSISPMFHNPIKIEPSEKKPIIMGAGCINNNNSIPLKSTLTDPITCQTVSPPKKPGLKMEEKAAASATNKSHHSSSSSEIKSEGAVTTLMSSTSSKVGIFSLGSPPAGRTTNQAVRHIPNPALLFNRQNSSSSNSSSTTAPTSSSSPVTSPTNESYGKSPLPFSQKSPLKLEEHGLTTAILPALPFPGVSVPVQVKVDNDAAVPIPVPTPKQPTPEFGSLFIPKTSINTTTCSLPEEKIISPPPKVVTAAVEKNNLLTVQQSEPLPNKEVGNKTVVSSEQPTLESSKQEETTNQICKTEEIVKIEYMAEDVDLDIDVGIETAPILFQNSGGGNNEAELTTTTTSPQNDDNEKVVEEQNAPSISSSTTSTTAEKIEDIPSLPVVLSANEIKTENTCSTLDINDEQGDTNASPSVTSQDCQEEAKVVQLAQVSNTTPIEDQEESETISVKEKTEVSPPNSPTKLEATLKIDSTSTLPIAVEEEEKRRQVETDEGVKAVEQVETPETPVELQEEEENQEVESAVPMMVMVLEEVEGEKKEEKSVGEIPTAPEAVVDMSEVVTTQLANHGEIPDPDKSAELQIESMECEEASSYPSQPNILEMDEVEEDQHCMETEVEQVEENQNHEVVVSMSVNDEKNVDMNENENLSKEPAVVFDEPNIIPNQGEEIIKNDEEELPIAIVIKEQEEEAAPEIQVASDQTSCILATTTSAQDVMVCDIDQAATTTIQESTSSNEDDLIADAATALTPTLRIHTSSKSQDSEEIQTKDLLLCKSQESEESNSILNQITINPEAELQLADTDIMTERSAAANDDDDVNEPVVVVQVELESFEKEEEASSSLLTENINPSNNNTILVVKGEKDEGEEKLTESSSTSLLELNCPSAEANGIELSNPVTIPIADAQDNTSTDDSDEKIISTVPLGQVQVETVQEELSKQETCVDEICKNVQISEVTAPTAEDKNLEEEAMVFGVEDKVEEISTSTSLLPAVEELQVPTNDNDNNCAIEMSSSSFETTPIEVNVIDFDPQFTTIPDFEPSSTFFLPSSSSFQQESQGLDLDGDVEMTDDCLQIVTESQTPTLSPIPSAPITSTTFPLCLTEDSPISNISTISSSSSPLISATATITTSTAEISSNVMSSSIMESPISCRNSLESPLTSPEDNIKKMETTLEQVAVGLFASAAAAANNNNKTIINAPNCEIAITTTSASDIGTTTVGRREACLHN